jgi:predicted small lipoprotein YifL
MRYCKFLLLLPLILALISLAACGNTQPPDDIYPPYEDTADIEVMATDEPVVELPATDATEAIKPPFEGKIAIITSEFPGNSDYYSAFPLVEKYGKEKILHVWWPISILSSDMPQDGINSMLLDLGSDSEIKAIIINPSITRISAALEKLREIRKDIYVICVGYNFSSEEYKRGYLQTADLVLATDALNMGSAIAEQAKKLGAKTFVHYSYPLPYYEQSAAKKLDLIKAKCAELSIKFVDATVPDLTSDIVAKQYIPDYEYMGAIAYGLIEREFIFDDVSKMIEKYGKNTAFFSTGCVMQAPLIEAVLDTGAIYPSPCHPYPFHGYPVGEFGGVIDLASGEYFDLGYSYLPYKDDFEKCIEIGIAKVRADLEGKGDLSRLSTWPVFDSFMYASTAAEYAIKWINGEVPKEGVDVAVLTQLMEEYAGVNVYLTPFVDDGTHDYYKREGKPTGETYNNFLLMRMDYVTFEELGAR